MTRSTWSLGLLCTVALACGESKPTPAEPSVPTEPTTTPSPVTTIPTDGTRGLLGDGVANPFPSALLVDADGHLALDPATLPSGGETPLPVDRLTWRTGFSSSQTAVIRAPGLRAEGLPDPDDAPGCCAVRMADLTDGRWLSCMAELDAHPEAVDPVLIVRPMEVLPDGHRIAVTISTDVLDRPAPFDGLLQGAPPADLVAHQGTHDAMMQSLEGLGIDPATLALAWDFPVDRGIEPVPSALEQLSVSGQYVLAVDTAPTLPLTWRTAVGTYEVTDFLVDDLALVLDEQGGVVPQGTTDAVLWVHVPSSVADAPAGSVPVLVFGHGIFASPEDYLGKADDPSSVLALADELGVIAVGTTWRGLTTSDLTGATQVAADFGRFHELTDRLVQAQVNVRTLAEAVRMGAIVDHPDLLGASGQSLADTSTVLYYGISLGGIAGSVMWANDPPIDRVALHVGGSMWSTMLERSSNFPLFELALTLAVPEPSDRQVLYSFSQLFWDPVDPMSWAPELAERDLLLSVAIHDEQVPNMTSEALARSIGLPLLAPASTSPFGLSVADGPLPRAMVQLDPERVAPPAENRPADVTDAHTTPRGWVGHRQQVIRYLETGEVVHFCGDTPCTPSNPGDLP